MVEHDNKTKMKEEVFLNMLMPMKDKMYRLAKRMLVSVDEAEDAVQETLMKLWINRSSLSSYRHPEAFIMTMVRNYCLDRLKSKQSAHLSLAYVREQKGGNTPDKEVVLNEAVNSVRDLIEKLPEKQRTVIHLRDIEQYELDEIADIMKMTPIAVRVNLSRARKKIREQLIKKYQYGQA